MASAASNRSDRSRRGARTCVGCGVAVPQRARSELVRLVIVPEGQSASVRVDLAGSARGRGAWVHPRPGCLDRAVSRGLARAATRPVVVDRAGLVGQLVAGAERRVDGLVASALRSGKIAVGASAVRRSWHRGKAKLLLVAADAAAAARLTEVRQAVDQGRALVWRDKAHWAAAMSATGDEVGVLAVESDSIAAEIRRVVALAECAAAEQTRQGAALPRPGGDAERAAGRRATSRPGTSHPAGTERSRRGGGDVRFRAE